MSDRSDLKNPSLSASKMATKDTSGISRPSRRRLIPTNTSYFPIRKSRITSIRSIKTLERIEVIRDLHHISQSANHESLQFVLMSLFQNVNKLLSYQFPSDNLLNPRTFFSLKLLLKLVHFASFAY